MCCRWYFDLTKLHETVGFIDCISGDVEFVNNTVWKLLSDSAAKDDNVIINKSQRSFMFKRENFLTFFHFSVQFCSLWRTTYTEPIGKRDTARKNNCVWRNGCDKKNDRGEKVVIAHVFSVVSAIVLLRNKRYLYGQKLADRSVRTQKECLSAVGKYIVDEAW